MRYRIIVPLFVICAMGFAQGCGGNNSEQDASWQYKQNVNAAWASFGDTLMPVAGSINTESSPDTDATTMKIVADGLLELERELETIKPPSDTLKDEHARLSKQVGSFASTVQNSAGQDETVFATQTKLAISQLKSTIDSINDQI